MGQRRSRELLCADSVLELRRQGLRARVRRERAIHCLLSQQCRKRDVPLGLQSLSDDNQPLAVTVVVYFVRMRTHLFIAASAVLCILSAGAVLALWRGSFSAAVAEPAHQALSSAFATAPTSGPAPLTVEFSYHADFDRYYSIDFGDGQSNSISVCGRPTGSYRGGYCSFTATHTYSSPGIYTARLIESCVRNTLCKAPFEQRIDAAAKITVGR
ncbi:PKD domain-containing protein [Bradyrhizobium manausense]|uniref:PKD domain-containing protein n=1 Tax=Bradyrhizobium manausense TaxID=989370 RepID=UPI003D31BA74